MQGNKRIRQQRSLQPSLKAQTDAGQEHAFSFAQQHSGQPLEPAVRAAVEPQFGHDFSNIRVHNDQESTIAASGIQARAYAVGNDLVFNSNQYNPSTQEGQRLLKHELTHAVQYQKSGDQSQTKALSQTSDAAENEARAMSTVGAKVSNIEAKPSAQISAAPENESPSGQNQNEDNGFDFASIVNSVITGQLQASVGNGGENRGADVLFVCSLLVQAGYTGTDLESEIRRFQSEVLKMSKPDGRIDVGGKTWKALLASASAKTNSPAQNTTSTASPDTTQTTTTPEPIAENTNSNTTVPAGDGSVNVTSVSGEIDQLSTKSKSLKRDGGNQELGAGRDELVASIKVIHAHIEQLPEAARPALFQRVNALTPYYSQSPNMNLLEQGKPEDTRTCNITSLAMALEGLGKSPKDYTGSKETIAGIAQFYDATVQTAEDHAGSSLETLRMPDYIQLAAIALEMGGKPPTQENIEYGVFHKTVDSKLKEHQEGAWNSILSIYTLQKIAEKFGVSSSVVNFNLTSNDSDDAKTRRKEQSKDFSTLRGIGSTHRGNVEKLTDERNMREELEGMDSTSKAYSTKSKALEKLEKANEGKNDLSEEALKAQEDLIPMQEYKARVTETVGAKMDSGAQVVMGLSGHYVRVQSIQDAFVIVDDPARGSRANRKVMWEEARAMAYFSTCLLIE